MTRPSIIRADTIDLQDQISPSAKDHSRQPTHPAAIGNGPPAPHQAETLREVAANEIEEQHRSPRVSSDWVGDDNDEGQISHDGRGTTNAAMQKPGADAVAHNVDHTAQAHDEDVADPDADDSLDEDDMMDKISSSPSIDDEDIDFEFVYALHTFVATVEGQANATKGDTMVLLDDSNSYWWLVRVVKDSSIGYLPAEHIETPTERLARLNKHRNVDLTATMLGDTMEKSKNPLRKAIRRRNAKSVAFAAPVYFEASDNDYSSEEEEEEFVGHEHGQGDTKSDKHDEETTSTDQPSELTETGEARVKDLSSEKDSSIKPSTDPADSTDDLLDSKLEGPGRMRNGTVRNTDSFFKDDTVETRKITITPNILRDDSSNSTRASNESKESRQRPSLEKTEKEVAVDKKEDKKKKDKEKKPGMLSGLFKRKDKKSKLQDEDVDELIYGKKASVEDLRVTPTPDSHPDEGQLKEEQSSPTTSSSPQRSASKLQKQRQEPQAAKPVLEPKLSESQNLPPPERAAPTLTLNEPSSRLAQSEPVTVEDAQLSSTNSTQPTIQTPDDQKSSGTFAKMLRARSNSGAEPKPEKLKKAKGRLDLDDSDASAEPSPIEAPTQKEAPVRPIPGAFPDSYMTLPGTDATPMVERLSESPVEVTHTDATSASHPPALMGDNSSQEEASSPISSPSLELVDADDSGKKNSEISSSTTTSSAMTTWNDAHLRTFFDDDSEIKDLLMVVYDKSGVVPAGPDHPITGGLFKNETAKLADITQRLDLLLGDWLARKTTTTR